ncbi:hypothetical protein L916_02730 [Phytophthora nicotianae]|uniref:Uncharacterized protein n=1 Tax=Phytophthora nicotianae TaxID=4792 RepID=W2JM71_PHYNI|nr:hypothetical protein L916_02730 [Phytophthora nicotianae]
MLRWDTGCLWKHVLDGFAPRGKQRTSLSGGDTTVLAAAVTQLLSSVSTMQRALQKLVKIQEPSSSASPGNTSCSCATENPRSHHTTDVVVEAHALAGCFYN